MQQQNKAISIINLVFLLFGVTLFIYSGWNLFFKKTYVPNLVLFSGSILLTSTFAGLTIARHKGRIAIAWTFLAILNSTLFVYLYFEPEHLKELYPLSIWIFLAILISSLQQVLDRMKKRFHSTMRIFNFGLILILIPVYLLKSESPLIWTIFSWFTLLLMLANLTLFLLPVTPRNQSR